MGSEMCIRDRIYILELSNIWESGQIADEAGHSNHLVSSFPKSDYRFDFMHYELQRKGFDVGQTEICQLAL